MGNERLNDIRAFKNFVEQQHLRGGDAISVEDVVARWEYENQSAEAREATLEAIREGLDDMHAGRTMPAEEVFGEIRRKYGLTER